MPTLYLELILNIYLTTQKEKEKINNNRHTEQTTAVQD